MTFSFPKMSFPFLLDFTNAKRNRDLTKTASCLGNNKTGKKLSQQSKSCVVSFLALLHHATGTDYICASWSVCIVSQNSAGTQHAFGWKMLQLNHSGERLDTHKNTILQFVTQTRSKLPRNKRDNHTAAKITFVFYYMAVWIDISSMI